MGAGVGAAPGEVESDPSSTQGQALPLDPADWQRAAGRVVAYLAAMGVREVAEVDRIGEQVRLRVEARAAAGPLEDPVEAAIEETHGLLDLWLVAELGLDGDSNALCAARAAVLGGGVPGWSARWAGFSEQLLAPEIRALCIAAVPEPAPLIMEPNPIDLFLHRLGCRLATGFNRLLCRPAGPKAAARGHQ